MYCTAQQFYCQNPTISLADCCTKYTFVYLSIQKIKKLRSFMKKFLRKRTSACKVKHPGLRKFQIRSDLHFLNPLPSCMYAMILRIPTNCQCFCFPYFCSDLCGIRQMKTKICNQQDMSILRKNIYSIYTALFRNNKSRCKPRIPTEEKSQKVLF